LRSHILTLSELNIKTGIVNIFTDNKAAINICNNNIINQKNKHIDIRFHFISELISKNKFKLTYVKYKMNLVSSWGFGLKITRSTQRLNYNLKKVRK